MELSYHLVSVKMIKIKMWGSGGFCLFEQGATIKDQKVCIVPWGGSEEAVNRWKKQMIKFQEEGNTQGVISFTYFSLFLCLGAMFK